MLAMKRAALNLVAKPMGDGRKVPLTAAAPAATLGPAPSLPMVNPAASIEAL
jgi:hypothetical protein